MTLKPIGKILDFVQDILLKLSDWLEVMPQWIKTRLISFVERFR